MSAQRAPADGLHACDEHLRRPWLLQLLDGHLERRRAHIHALLALDDDALIAALGGAREDEFRREWQRWRRADAERAREAARRRGLTLICRCQPEYPASLHDLDAAPAVLHLAGDPDRFLSMCDAAPVAIVGARRSTPYGDAVAESLGRKLAAAGTPVISGMAGGIDSSAHLGALRGGGATVAVLSGVADVAYPRGGRALHKRIVSAGAVVSEQGPGASTRPWTFTARNRIIAALARVTIVVEARERSGALVTAAAAQALARRIGAVPGMVTSPASVGPNRLLAEGAAVIRDAQDALDAVYGIGIRVVETDQRPPMTPIQRGIFEAVAAGAGTPRALARAGYTETTSMVELATLEVAGWVRRGPGGRYTVVA